MDYLKFLNIVRRFLWLIVLTTLISSLTTYFVLNNQPATFTAKSRLLVGPSMESASLDLNSLKIGGQLIQTYAELVTAQSFLESVNSKLDQKTDPKKLASMIETKQNADTRILTIIVTHQDPKQAVAIANAAAETLIEMSPSKENTTALLREQMSNQSRLLEEIIANSQISIQQLDAKLIELGSAKELTPEEVKVNLEQQNLTIKQIAEERSRLSDALRTQLTIYQVLLDTNTNQVEIIEPAGEATHVSQNIPQKAAASGAAGLILAVSIIFAFEYLNDTIRFPVDVSRIAKLPLLSTIDKHNRLDGSGLERIVAFAQPQSRAANSYRTVVAKLLLSAGKSIPYTFLLSSVGSQSGDDAATVTMNLAVAFAQAGNRVVVVDAQLHNPILTKLFKAEGSAGLSDLLVTNSTKLQLILVKEVPGVRFLPAGLSSEKGPGAVLNSAKMVKLAHELYKEADIVLVAGSSISWFAESLALASQVNGIILVARPGEAHSKMVNEVVENLSVMHARLIGVIFDHNPSPFVSKQNLRSVTENGRFSRRKPPVLEAEFTPEPLESIIARPESETLPKSG